MATTLHHPQQQARHWVLIDAKDQVLGRLASRVAIMLRGKHKAAFTPYIDTGDFVIVINAQDVKITGRKSVQKVYDRYSGYPSGRSERTFEQVMSTHPTRVIREAVKGMLPDGPMGRHMLRKLKVYAGSEHPHAAQQLTPLTGWPLVGTTHASN